MIKVFSFGAFDMLHPGHIILLKRAKALGDYLTVGIVGDEAIRKLKGKDRPIYSQIDRAVMVANLKMVDKVILQKTYNPDSILRKIKPDILTKGDDWAEIPGTKTIKKLGGKLVKLPYSKKWSTSATIKKIIKSAVEKASRKCL